MKTPSSFLLGAALATSAWMVPAPQAVGPANVAVINGDVIIEQSNVGQAAFGRLEVAATQWEERVTTATRELQALQRQRQEQSLTLNERALGQLTRDIEEKQVEIQRMNDDARRDLQRLQDEVTAEVNRQLGPLLEQFAAREGLDMIFDVARLPGLLYFGNSRDLTTEFLQLVNENSTEGSDQVQE